MKKHSCKDSYEEFLKYFATQKLSRNGRKKMLFLLWEG